MRDRWEVRIFPRMEFASQDAIEIDGIEIGPGMTREQAETLYARGKDVAVFVMMVLAKKLAMETATSTDVQGVRPGLGFTGEARGSRIRSWHDHFALNIRERSTT